MKNVRSAIVLAAVLLTTLVSCGSKPPADQHIGIGVGGQSLPVYLPLTLAQQLGYFEQEGLRVSIEDMQGGSKALQALEGGSVDAVAGYYDHTIQMQAKKKELTSFVTMLDRPELVLAVSPQTSRPIGSISDLAGTNVGVSSPGSSTDLFLKYILSKTGLAPDAVNVQAIGTGTSAVEAMEQGRVDAAVMIDPALSIFQQRAGADKVKILADTRTATGVQQIYGVPNYPAAVLYSTRQWLDGNSEGAHKLAAAIVRTLHWIDAHTADEIAARMPAEYTQDNRDLYVQTIRDIKDGFSPNGFMTADGPEAVRKVLAQFDPAVAGADIDLSRTYTNEYLPRTN